MEKELKRPASSRQHKSDSVLNSAQNHPDSHSPKQIMIKWRNI